ncbi:MAG: hypothetical protein CSB55_07275 [Candidatus Cloacimonadota bacterium]|nr:MAG: hypothetical protein CSB55_07275 [Candidatus Cloacimonadota bacterium]
MRFFYLFLLIVFWTGCSFSEKKIDEYDIKVVNKTDITIDYTGLTYFNDNFYAYNYLQIERFDENGASDSLFQEPGEGPGEFRMVNSLGVYNGALVLSDFALRRITFLGKDFNLLKTNLLPETIVDDIKQINDKLVFAGMKTLSDETEKKVSLATIFDIDEKFNLLNGKEIFNLDENLLKKLDNSKVFIDLGCSVCATSKDDIFLANPFLPFIFKYSIENESVSRKKIEFKNYQNPFETNEQKVRKSSDMIAKGYDKLMSFYLVDRPVFSCFIEKYDVVVVQYAQAVQNLFKNNEPLYTLLVYDCDLNLKAEIHNNYKIFDYSKKNDYFICKEANKDGDDKLIFTELVEK